MRAKCRTYYAADRTVCPVCKPTERVSPNAVSPVTAVNERAPEDCGDDAALAAERERFLWEFKSRVFAQHAMREGLPQQVLYGMEANKQ